MSLDLLSPEYLLGLGENADPDCYRAAFFAMARERYDILLRKIGDYPKPWSKYPAFQTNRFCNVFREDDKTTGWFRENMRNETFCGSDRTAMILTTVAFRWFNKIEIGEVLKDKAIGLAVGRFNAEEAKARILFTYPKGPFVTGAYIVKTPDGMTKLDGVLWCISNVAENIKTLSEIIQGNSTLEVSWEELCRYPFLGPFMSYEVITDLAYTPLLQFAEDRMTWANPGPGAARGLSRILFGNPDRLKRENKVDRGLMMVEMQHLLRISQNVELWPWPGRPWEMREVEHGLCEFDKFIRVIQGGRMKQKYDGVR